MQVTQKHAQMQRLRRETSQQWLGDYEGRPLKWTVRHDFIVGTKTTCSYKKPQIYKVSNFGCQQLLKGMEPPQCILVPLALPRILDTVLISPARIVISGTTQSVPILDIW